MSGTRYNGMVHIRYQTSSATLVQFILGTLLTFVTGGVSIVSSCQTNGSDCVSNTFVSLVLVLFVIMGYGLLLAVGFLAQERRSSRLALLLIGLEGFAGLIFLFDAKQAPGMVDRLTNILSLLVAIWVSYVALQLYRAKGARIVRTAR